MPDEAPTAISWATGRIDLFVRGRDNALYHKWFDNGWSADWQYLGGILISPPLNEPATAGEGGTAVGGVPWGQ